MPTRFLQLEKTLNAKRASTQAHTRSTRSSPGGRWPGA
jgi:hypothetical protein